MIAMFIEPELRNHLVYHSVGHHLICPLNENKNARHYVFTTFFFFHRLTVNACLFVTNTLVGCL